MAYYQDIINEERRIPTWEELLESLNNAGKHPNKTGWDIYRYMKQNLADMAPEPINSEQARGLMACYIKIPMDRPSLLHSLMLGLALKMADKFIDFKLPTFLQLWSWPDMLRPEDKERQTSKDGKTFLSLQEKTERALQHYMLHHSEEREITEEKNGILTMAATKIFETTTNTTHDGKTTRRRTVKLIGPHGEEILANSHLFPCKPWEIMGKLFDVLIRSSKDGNWRAAGIAFSKKSVEEVFPPTIGFIDSFDEKHNHFHIFDNLSRHFVAENPPAKIRVGEFIRFSPIIPQEDKFKSAIVIHPISYEEGVKSWGILDAMVKFVEESKGFFYYHITSPLPQTPEGIYTQEASAKLSCLVNNYHNRSGNKEETGKIAIGDRIQLLIFLKRSKDGLKHNYVAQAWLK